MKDFHEKLPADTLSVFPEIVHSQISSLVSVIEIAAIFHDMGKNTKGFQWKMKEALSSKRAWADPLRHEAISAAFWSFLTEGMTDREVIEMLCNFDRETSQVAQEKMEDFCRKVVLNDLASFRKLTCFTSTSSLRNFIGLIILTHHRACSYAMVDGKAVPKTAMYKKGRKTYLKQIKAGLPGLPKDREFFQVANSDRNFLTDASIIERVRASARNLKETGMMANLGYLPSYAFLGRNAMMMADHMGSNDRDLAKSRDRGKPIANTIENDGVIYFADTLVKHTLKVVSYVETALKTMTFERNVLPSLSGDNIPDGIKNPWESKKDTFKWQFRTAMQAAELSGKSEAGFFSAIISDTGRGKTRGGITALAAATLNDANPDNRGLRCTIGLPLRTLATQFAAEYHEDLGFAASDIGLIIGESLQREIESDEDMLSTDGDDMEANLDLLFIQDMVYASNEDDPKHVVSNRNADSYPVTPFVSKLIDSSPRNSEKLQRLFGKPLLIATLDHLMPVTQAERSYHLHAAIRLASSDVLIDEIDLFSQKDISAICRLAYLTGAAGRRFMVTSATAREAVVEELFQSYRKGYGEYAELYDKQDRVHALIASHAADGVIAEEDCSSIRQAYADCVNSISRENSIMRIKSRGDTLRKLRISEPLSGEENYVEIANVIQRESNELHCDNHIIVQDPDQGDSFRVSIGLVKITRINQLVNILKVFPENPEAVQRSIVLHSNMISETRRGVESTLRKILNRKKMGPHLETLAEFLSSTNSFQMARDRGLLDIQIKVFASPVIETGNDLDFDYGVLDPSSLSMTRSMVQGGGRINRHRRDPKSRPNVVVLSRPLVSIPYGALAFPGIQTPVKSVDEDADISGDAVIVPRNMGPMETRYLMADINAYPFDQTIVLKDQKDNISLDGEEDIQGQLFRRSPSLEEYQQHAAAAVGVNHARLRRFRETGDKTVDLYRSFDEKFYMLETGQVHNGIVLDDEVNPNLGVIGHFYNDRNLYAGCDPADGHCDRVKIRTRINLRVDHDKTFYFNRVYGIYTAKPK